MRKGDLSSSQLSWFPVSCFIHFVTCLSQSGFEFCKCSLQTCHFSGIKQVSYLVHFSIRIARNTEEWKSSRVVGLVCCGCRAQTDAVQHWAYQQPPGSRSPRPTEMGLGRGWKHSRELISPVRMCPPDGFVTVTEETANWKLQEVIQFTKNMTLNCYHSEGQRWLLTLGSDLCSACA